MSLPTNLPWIGSPTANLPLSDPRCNSDNCRAFYNAHELSQQLYSYHFQYDYGHLVTWYYLAFIGVFCLVYILGKRKEYQRRSRATSAESNKPSTVDKFIALWRYAGYRRVSGWWSGILGLPSMGMLAFLLLAVLYCSILTFDTRPYYRQHRGYGSPMLAVRTGLMAVALTPLIIALSGKANIVTLLTGIGHERLNVIHRWVGWICFGLSVVHTIPFIVAPLRDGGYAALHAQFYKPGGFEYTGVPPLAILFGMLVLSIPWLRHRFYEGFYHIHFWLAVAYVGLMFWHAGNEGDSWVYLWATITAWLLQILARAFWFWRPTRVTQSQWLEGSTARLRAMPGNLTKLEILPPLGFRWHAGQHCFLRFPAVNPLDNHPFTIASSAASDETEQTLRFYIQSHAGFSRRLQEHISRKPDSTLETWIDGPYGGHPRDLCAFYDSIILVAGGSGISLCLPWLEEVVARMRKDPLLRTRFLKLVWTVRRPESLSWISDEVKALNPGSLRPKVELVFHVTGQQTATRDVENDPGSSNSGHRDDIALDVVRSGLGGKATVEIGMDQARRSRINMTQLLSEVTTSPRTVIIACGPESLKVDLSNAVAQSQREVLRGRVQEVALWTETFGW